MFWENKYILKKIIRKHPFNLKGGGGGAMVVFQSRNSCFCFVAERKCFLATSYSDIIFFYKTIFLGKVLSEYFFFPCQNLLTEHLFPTKNHSTSINRIYLNQMPSINSKSQNVKSQLASC